MDSGTKPAGATTSTDVPWRTHPSEKPEVNALKHSSPSSPSSSSTSSSSARGFPFVPFGAEQGGAEGDAPPQPLEALHAVPVPPFLTKTYELVEDRRLDPIVSWGARGESFVVWDTVEFSKSILPRHFKHSNFSSFVRQLNTYGFRKVDTDRWEFANEDFLRGKKHLLRNIQRRRSSQTLQVGCSSSVEMGKSGASKEIEKLRMNKEFLMHEILELEQEQRSTIHQMNLVKQKMQSAERRQKQMVTFLAKVIQNPVLLEQLRHLKERRRIGSSRPKKFLKHNQSDKCNSANNSPPEGTHSLMHTNVDPSVTKELSEYICGDKPAAKISEEFLYANVAADYGTGEMAQPLYMESNDTATFKGKNVMCSPVPETIFNFGHSDSFMSPVVPEGFSLDEIVMEDDVSHDKIFEGSTANPATESMSLPDAAWSLGFDCGLEMMHSAWNEPFSSSAQALEVAPVSSPLLELGLQQPELEALGLWDLSGGDSPFHDFHTQLEIRKDLP